MAADRSLRHRLSTQVRAVRTRIAAWVVLLTGLALLGAGLTAYLVESDRIERRTTRAITQEIEEFEALQSKGIDPETGVAFAGAERLMVVAMQRNVPDDSEAIVGLLEGQRPLVPPGASPSNRRLPRDPAFMQAAHSLFPDGGARRFETSLGEVVMAVKPVRDPSTRGAYVVAYFPAQERREFVDVMQIYTGVAAGAMLLVSAGAWLVAGRLLEPVRRLRATAQEISDTDLSRRIETTGNDDLTDLSNTFNAMLDRLEQSFAQQRRFLDDAGHELRTPITIVRGHLELLDTDSAEDTETTRSLVLDEVDRMGRLVDDLIVLAKAGRPDFARLAEADVGILTDEVLDKVRALGDRAWKLDERADGTVRVDPQRVTQALVQLAKNAVQHTNRGDVIAVGSSLDRAAVCWWVRDTGPGLTHADADRVFERFQRGHHARGADGSGLGLSIVRAIARAHGGDVHVHSPVGEGATFTLQIPYDGRPETTEV